MRCRALLIALVLSIAPTLAQAAPALWEVSDADSKVWLFGSIHVLPKDIVWRTPAFDDVLKQVDQVYFEADIGPMGQLGLILTSLKMGFTQHQDWLQTLTPDQSSKLMAAITPLGMTGQQLGGYAPWLAEAMVENAVLQKLGYQADLGVDETLQAELPKEKKGYFETAAGQMQMLAGAPEDRQITRLMTTVDDVPNMPREISDMARAWSSGNADSLAKSVTDDPTMDKGFTQTMVLDRNARWAPVIEQMLAQNRQNLIVVGAGHLVGDGSVIDLLTKAGFTVQRIQ
jgi:uncharacterized protein YbaP (TraB family)